MLDGDAVVDAGFDGDMVAFIEAGAPVGATAAASTGARLLAPLRPRSLRDFLAFEGHLKNAYRASAATIPAEWYEVPAYYKGMPDTVDRARRRDPVAGVHRQARPRARARRGDRPHGAATSRREDAAGCIFGYTIWNDMSARDVQARELPGRHGAGQGQGLGRLQRARPLHRHRRRARRRRRAHARARQRRDLGRGHVSAHMHHTFADMIAYASRSQTLYPGEVLGSGTAAGGSGLELDRWLAEGDVVELEIEGIGVLRNRIGRKGALTMAYVVCRQVDAPRRARRSRLLEVIEEMTAAVARGARATVFYQAQRSPEDPRLFFLYEQYVDEAGYEAHMDSEHFTRLVKQEAIPELLEAREREFYETIDDDRGRARRGHEARERVHRPRAGRQALAGAARRRARRAVPARRRARRRRRRDVTRAR